MACAEPRLTALKVGYKGEIHRIRIDLSSFKLEDLNRLFVQTFKLAPGSFVVQYKDSEGDCLNVCSEAEYTEACRVFLTGADAVKALRFVAVSRTHVAFQENVADPILKAIEKLVETLNAAMEKVKQEEWAQRAQSGAQQTSDAVKSAAMSAAHEARESFAIARQSIQDIPFDEVLKETADNLKVAAESVGSFAQEMVDELKNMSVYHPAVPQVVAQPEETVEVTEPAPVSSGSDSEWEQVTPAPVKEVPTPEPEVVAPPAPVVSEEELKWAEELNTVRSIFPNMETAVVIEKLEQCNGNVEVVVNALMEEM